MIITFGPYSHVCVLNYILVEVAISLHVDDMCLFLYFAIFLLKNTSLSLVQDKNKKKKIYGLDLYVKLTPVKNPKIEKMIFFYFSNK